MGDMGEIFNAVKAEKKARRAAALDEADTSGFTQHSPHHFSTTLLGDRLDWWPSSTKFRWRGKTYTGGVHGFIKNKEKR